LTPAERECLSLAADGLHSDQIAARLGLSVALVRAHLDAARIALGAASKLEAVLIADRHGLIPTSERSIH
jgi:DNA-binding CsgD family transcriptional regulator